MSVKRLIGDLLLHNILFVHISRELFPGPTAIFAKVAMVSFLAASFVTACRENLW